MKPIDFNLILGEMLKGILTTLEIERSGFTGVSPLTILKEFRTLIIKPTRQTGKTRFIAEGIKRGNAILIVSDDMRLDLICSNNPGIEEFVYTEGQLQEEHFHFSSTSDPTFVFIDDFELFVDLDAVMMKLIAQFGNDFVVIKM